MESLKIVAFTFFLFSFSDKLDKMLYVKFFIQIVYYI